MTLDTMQDYLLKKIWEPFQTMREKVRPNISYLFIGSQHKILDFILHFISIYVPVCDPKAIIECKCIYYAIKGALSTLICK